MKIFNTKLQNKVIDFSLLLYLIVSAVFISIGYFKLFGNDIQQIHYFYLFIIFLNSIILLFRNKLKLEKKAFVLVLILIISGLLENYYFDNYKGFFFCIMSFLVSSFVFKQKTAFSIWIFAIVSLLTIGIFRNTGLIKNDLVLNLSHISWSDFIERMIIFTMLTALIVWALSSFKKTINQIIDNNNQEKLKYKPLFDQTYSFISLLNNKGEVIESNQAALYYIQSTNSEVKDKNFQDTNWWSTSNKSKEIISKNLEASLNGDFRRFEATHRNSDGFNEYFDYTLKPIFDRDYSVKFIIAEGRNISAIKKAKQALVEGEERLLALTESTYEGIIISNDGAIVEANKSALKLLHVTNIKEYINKNFIKTFIHPEEQNMVYEKVKENFIKPYETKAVCTDGTEVPIEIEGRDIIYKGKLHRVSALRDLTERRLAQKALINSEEKYRLITENIIDIICKLDEKLHFTYVSTSVYNMLGYTVREMETITLKEITTKESFLSIVSKLNIKKKQLKLKSPEVWTGVSFESVLKHKSGKLLWTHINAKLVNWGQNDTYEILCVTRNIDTIKKIQFTLEENENRLKLQNEEYERLNSELTELNNKLRQAKFKAEESDKLKSAFLANMSHEIRTPMNSIIGFSRMFKNRDIDDDKRYRYADFVINNGKDLLNIVNDILDLSKIESGQIQLKKTTFNLNEIIENLYDNIVEQNRKGLMIIRQKELSDEDSYIYSDKNRLTQVIGNLINNAYKFTKKCAIKFGYNILDKKILFYIEDSGIGIPSEQQEKIFERFRQVEMEASRVFGGAGLGLSISKKMVELLNGKIWLKSELGVGSTFYVTIPFTATNPETIISKPAFKKPTNTMVKNEQTILIAEDDESNFFYLNELLIDYNYKILRAKNGEEAVELVTKNKSIVMIFMDIKMPIMDGFEATKRIKKINPSIPIIAQTAFAMADDKDTAIKNGCDDYMSKPIDPETLYEKIKKYAPN